MKIAINGSLGSGKSTVGKILAENLGYNYHSTGEWFRQLAKERGLSVVELNILAEKDPSIDDMIDTKLKELNNSDKLVIDSRMAVFFIDSAFKVRLTVSEEEGANRIWKDDKRGNTEKFSSFEEALAAYQKRSASEKKRYSDLYGVDIEEGGDYDLRIDSTNMGVRSIVQTIENAFLEKYKK